MPPQNFKCTQCGNCCLNLYDAFSTCATEEDIQLWQKEGREDILEWVRFIALSYPRARIRHASIMTKHLELAKDGRGVGYSNEILAGRRVR
jgi:hypothetical protein